MKINRRGCRVEHRHATRLMDQTDPLGIYRDCRSDQRNLTPNPDVIKIRDYLLLYPGSSKAEIAHGCGINYNSVDSLLDSADKFGILLYEDQRQGWSEARWKNTTTTVYYVLQDVVTLDALDRARTVAQ